MVYTLSIRTDRPIQTVQTMVLWSALFAQACLFRTEGQCGNEFAVLLICKTEGGRAEMVNLLSSELPLGRSIFN